MKLFILLAIVASASAAACADTLSLKECATCTGETHVPVCKPTMGTCLKCDDTAAACTSHCEGKGFVTKDKSCIKCTAISNCATPNLSCKLDANKAIDAKSLMCSKCNADSQISKKASTADICIKVGVADCHAMTQQTCDEKEDRSGCKDKTKGCAKCATTHHRVAGVKGTSDDSCTSVAIDGCDALTPQSCTIASGATTCTANSKRCSKCALTHQQFSKSDADDKCVAVGIANCEGQQGCTEDATTKQSCKADSKTCAKCSAGYFKLAKASKNNACFQISTRIAHCKSGFTCEVDDAGTGCKANTAQCGTCNDGYFKLAKSGKDHKCIAGWSATDGIANCKSGFTCEVDDAGTACKAGSKRCGECTTAPLYYKLAKDGKDNKCIKVDDSTAGISNCKSGFTCDADDAGTACKANTKKCTMCYTFAQKMSPASKDEICLKVMDNCKEAQCTPDDAKTACKANSKVCKVPSDSYVVNKVTDKDDALVKVDITNCNKATCTLKSGACDANSKRCTECQSTHYKKSADGKDDTCEACLSSSAKCNALCKGYVSVGDKCKIASTLSGVELQYCASAASTNHMSYVVSAGSCTNLRYPTCVEGTCIEAYQEEPTKKSGCTRCAAYQAASKYTTPKPTAKLTTCTKCSKTTCTAGSCSDSLTLQAGVCKAAASGNGTGNSTNSTGCLNVPTSLFMFSVVLLALV